MGGWRQVRGKAATRGERQEEQGQRPPGSQLMTFLPQEMWCLFTSTNMLANLEGLCLCVEVSKHLKGQLDPPVSNGHVFAPKEVSWTPL